MLAKFINRLRWVWGEYHWFLYIWFTKQAGICERNSRFWYSRYFQEKHKGSGDNR